MSITFKMIRGYKIEKLFNVIIFAKIALNISQRKCLFQ